MYQDLYRTSKAIELLKPLRGGVSHCRCRRVLPKLSISNFSPGHGCVLHVCFPVLDQ